MEMTANADYVITLVHGTWADTKGWVAPGSLLRRELERGLADERTSAPPARGGGSVVFRAFAWTGANTHAARTEAGAGLARFIRDGHAQYPLARHFVIAHSHGGNVALYAMRDRAARAVVAGIVTLATPFIYTRRRRFHRHVTSMASLVLAVPAVFAFVMLDTLHQPALALAWIVGALFLILKIEPTLSKWLIDVGRREQAGIVAALQPPRIDPSMLLILSTRGDEASRWLRAWDVVAQGPFVIAGVLLTLLEGLARSRLYRQLGDITVLGIDGWMLASGLIVSCVICSVGLIFSGIMRWPGYWREPLRANLLVEIGTDQTTRAAGATSHTACSFELAGDSSRIRHRHLLHSAICDNAAVVSATLEWIHKGTRAQPSGIH
jgi:hypothetical protein